MSCVAEAKPVKRAQTAVSVKLSAGSLAARAQSPATTPACERSIHARRRPKRSVRKGMRLWSTQGAHIHLSAYTIPTQERKPMVARSTLASRIQKLRVPKINRFGSPVLKPRQSIRIDGRFP